LEDYQLRGFSNNYTPVDGTTITDFTESAFTGYGRININRNQMGDPGITANVAISECDFVPTWTCTGGAPENLYGWYLISKITSTVLAAQRFDAVRVMASGATEKIDPFQISLKSFVT
jgi:hypothetical protein